MASIVTETFSQQVVEFIKNQVREGHLAPGDKITELSIANTLSISQPPVREAMQILMAEGLVERRGKRARHITELSPKAIRDSYFAGGALEGSVVSNSLADFTENDFLVLDEIIDDMRIAVKNGCDVDELAALDQKFHKYLFSVSDNQIARQLWFRSCQAIGKYLFYKNWKAMQVPADYCQRHQQIVDTLKSKDKVLVERIIREHYVSVGQVMAEYAEKYYSERKKS